MKKGLTERDYVEMERLFTQEHLTLSEIGAWFGVSRQWVHQKLRKRGVDTKDRYHYLSAARKERECAFCGYRWMTGDGGGKHNVLHRTNLDGLDEPLALAYAQGVKLADICERFGVVETRIYHAVDRAGLARRIGNRRSPTVAQSNAIKERVIELRKLGMGTVRIANLMGISHTRVHQIDREYRDRTNGL